MIRRRPRGIVVCGDLGPLSIWSSLEVIISRNQIENWYEMIAAETTMDQPWYGVPTRLYIEKCYNDMGNHGIPEI